MELIRRIYVIASAVDVSQYSFSWLSERIPLPHKASPVLFSPPVTLSAAPTAKRARHHRTSMIDVSECLISHHRVG